MMRFLAVIGCLALFAATGVRASDADDDYTRALQRYADGDYAAAFSGLDAAARAGHVRAQEIVGFMALFGPALYRDVAGDPAAALTWLSQAGRAGREAARYTACVRTSDAPDRARRRAACLEH